MKGWIDQITHDTLSRQQSEVSDDASRGARCTRCAIRLKHRICQTLCRSDPREIKYRQDPDPESNSVAPEPKIARQAGIAGSHAWAPAVPDAGRQREARIATRPVGGIGDDVMPKRYPEDGPLNLVAGFPAAEEGTW